LRFSLVALAAKFCSVKTKSPLDSGAGSGLEIRSKELLNDSDRTPALAEFGTTTRRTETEVWAPIHDGESYMDTDAFAKGKIHRRWRTKSNGLAAP
jgi:hypothetical protein